MVKHGNARKGIGGPKRSPDQRLQQQAEVGELYLAHHSLREIAVKIGISKSQVGYDLQAIRNDWRQRSEAAIQEMIDEEVARIDDLERLYREGYKRSCRNAVRQSSSVHETTLRTGQEMVVPDKDQLTGEDALQAEEEIARAIDQELESGRTRRKSALSSSAPPTISVTSKVAKQASRSIERRDGDPRWLEGVRWCVRMRMELMSGFAIGSGILYGRTAAPFGGPESQTQELPNHMTLPLTPSQQEDMRRFERRIAPLDPKVRIDALDAVRQLVAATDNYNKYAHLLRGEQNKLQPPKAVDAGAEEGTQPPASLRIDVEADTDEEYDETA